MSRSVDIVIVGGCGRVGLPLGLAFAARGLSVTLYDINEPVVRGVQLGKMPFAEPEAQELLPTLLATGLEATTDPGIIRDAETVIVTIGTPIDEHLNPDPGAVVRTVDAFADYLVDDQLLVLRSTVYPGVTALVESALKQRGLKIPVAFCPERIAQGYALTELFHLPQIVAARSDKGFDRSEKLFRNLTSDIVRLLPEEAELAKLFTNVWRYIKFATANQLFMIANEFGCDYERIRTALIQDYPRATDLPSAGFTAGPCLFKDTMQLAAFNNNNFTLGHASMTINEGLPLYVLARLDARFDLRTKRVGILGMAFKGDSDDTRASLAYKLKRILRFKAAEVLCADPHVTTDPELLPVEEVVSRSDLLIIAAPHREFADLKTDKYVVDIWNLRGQGVRI
jgi:UDP-N-acetyl-D-mannosaminuronic acid dehydrogenase